jgi:hypothetical protein
MPLVDTNRCCGEKDGYDNGAEEENVLRGHDV